MAVSAERIGGPLVHPTWPPSAVNSPQPNKLPYCITWSCFGWTLEHSSRAHSSCLPVTGGAAADRLDGGAGSDTLKGGTGNSLANLLVGNDGDNVLNGGAGTDTFKLTTTASGADLVTDFLSGVVIRGCFSGILLVGTCASCFLLTF